MIILWIIDIKISVRGHKGKKKVCTCIIDTGINRKDFWRGHLTISMNHSNRYDKKECIVKERIKVETLLWKCVFRGEGVEIRVVVLDNHKMTVINEEKLLMRARIITYMRHMEGVIVKDDLSSNPRIETFLLDCRQITASIGCQKKNKCDTCRGLRWHSWTLRCINILEVNGKELLIRVV